jgi:hypothetical protein
MPSPSRSTWLSVSAVLLNSSKFIIFGCFGLPFRSFELVSAGTHLHTAEGGSVFKDTRSPLNSERVGDEVPHVLSLYTRVDVVLELTSKG